MRVLSQAIRKARDFRVAEAGAAAVEFALILPVMLLLYVGMVEGSTLISMDRKVQTISGAVGDLVARSNGAISSGTVDDYVKVAAGIMTPYTESDLVQVVSQVFVNSDGTATVDWSKRYADQVPQSGAYAKGANYVLPAEIIAIAKDQYVIVTECSLSYKPLYGIVFDQAVNLQRVNFFIPRFRDQIVLD